MGVSNYNAVKSSFQNQRGKKNILTYLGEDDPRMQYSDNGKGFQQRRAGMHEAPKLGVTLRFFRLKQSIFASRDSDDSQCD